ncbi:MAG: hypothetical protein IKI71_03440 [Lachnospiraceae bacterium]|nr:hypothetical protein [Lachnospiraceae bacterium]
MKNKILILASKSLEPWCKYVGEYIDRLNKTRISRNELYIELVTEYDFCLYDRIEKYYSEVDEVFILIDKTIEDKKERFIEVYEKYLKNDYPKIIPLFKGSSGKELGSDLKDFYDYLCKISHYNQFVNNEDKLLNIIFFESLNNLYGFEIEENNGKLRIKGSDLEIDINDVEYITNNLKLKEIIDERNSILESINSFETDNDRKFELCMEISAKQAIINKLVGESYDGINKCLTTILRNDKSNEEKVISKLILDGKYDEALKLIRPREEIVNENNKLDTTQENIESKRKELIDEFALRINANKGKVVESDESETQDLIFEIIEDTKWVLNEIIDKNIDEYINKAVDSLDCLIGNYNIENINDLVDKVLNKYEYLQKSNSEYINKCNYLHLHFLKYSADKQNNNDIKAIDDILELYDSVDIAELHTKNIMDYIDLILGILKVNEYYDFKNDEVDKHLDKLCELFIKISLEDIDFYTSKLWEFVQFLIYHKNDYNRGKYLFETLFKYNDIFDAEKCLDLSEVISNKDINYNTKLLYNFFLNKYGELKVFTKPKKGNFDSDDFSRSVVLKNENEVDWQIGMQLMGALSGRIYTPLLFYIDEYNEDIIFKGLSYENIVKSNKLFRKDEICKLVISRIDGNDIKNAEQVLKYLPVFSTNSNSDYNQPGILFIKNIDKCYSSDIKLILDYACERKKINYYKHPIFPQKWILVAFARHRFSIDCRALSISGRFACFRVVNNLFRKE